MEKAVGTVHTKVNNGASKGGIYIYVDVYKYFTETSGLGLAEQARRLMHPDPVKREEELTATIEDWIQKCDRLAEFGSQYELPTVYKTVALQCMLIGESKRMFEAWKLEGLTFDKILTKLKEYARSLRLDGDAHKGKQAVNMNWFQEGYEGENTSRRLRGQGGPQQSIPAQMQLLQERRPHCRAVLESKSQGQRKRGWTQGERERERRRRWRQGQRQERSQRRMLQLRWRPLC